MGKAMLWATFGAEVHEVMFELRWMIAFAMILIATDFYWGSRETVCVRGEKWHFSQAGRRTLNKVVEYLTYLLIGCVGGIAILEPIGVCSHVTAAAVGLGLGSVFEVSSIVGHVLAVHGVKKRFNVWSFIVSVVTWNRRELGNAMKDAVEDDDETGKDCNL